MADDALTATLGALTDASERARSVEAGIRTLAARAATEGANYGDIGRALGITRQGARKRFPQLFDAGRPATTEVVVPAEPGASRDSDRPERAASRPATADRPRARPARARSVASAMDKAMAAAVAMTEHAGYTLERIETGYRVIVDGVECGILRPDYTGTTTNRPRGWLPLEPGLVSVFPAGRSYRTRDEAVRHLLTDLRHRAKQRRSRRGEVPR